MSFASSASLLAAKDAEIASLRARDASVTRIAVQAVAVLRSIDKDGRPAGIWIREEDRDYLVGVQSSGMELVAGGRWMWEELDVDLAVPPSVSTILTDSVDALPRPAITPFQSAFPLEILEHIVALADPKTAAAFSQASFATLQLFAPRLLVNPVITKTTPGLQSLFLKRNPLSSSRLADALSLQHVQTLDVFATALVGASIAPRPSARLEPGKTSLQLAKLVIRMDFDPIEFLDPSDDLEWFEEMGGMPQVAVTSFQPSLTALMFLNPVKLRVEWQVKPPIVDRHFRITQSAAKMIASWTRLQEIELVNLEFYVVPTDVALDYEEIMDYEVEGGMFFLSPAIVNSSPNKGKKAGVKKWTITWDLSCLEEVKSFAFGYNRSLPHELAERDKTLQMKRIKSATILVRSAEIKAKLDAQMAEVDEKKRGPLVVEVKNPLPVQ